MDNFNRCVMWLDFRILRVIKLVKEKEELGVILDVVILPIYDLDGKNG